MAIHIDDDTSEHNDLGAAPVTFTLTAPGSGYAMSSLEIYLLQDGDWTAGDRTFHIKVLQGASEYVVLNGDWTVNIAAADTSKALVQLFGVFVSVLSYVLKIVISSDHADDDDVEVLIDRWTADADYALSQGAAVGSPTANSLTQRIKAIDDLTQAAGDGDLAAMLTASTAAAAARLVASGLVFRGTVTADDPGVSFTIATLAGLGAGAFVDAAAPWYAYVFRDAGDGAAAPQGEIRVVTGYTTGTGLFTTAAFSAAVATGDDVIVLNPRLADIAAILADTNELQTDWHDGQRLDLILDAVKLKTDLIGTSSVTYSTASAVSGHLDLYAGSDYLDADSRAVTAVVSSYGGPSLTAATLKLRLLRTTEWEADTEAADLEVTGALSVDGTEVTCKADLTKTNMTALAALSSYPPDKSKNYRWQFVATTAGATVLLLAAGSCTVHKGIEASAMIGVGREDVVGSRT